MARKLSGRVVLATHNSGKLKEMRELLAPHGVEVVSAGELGLPEPEENGATFEANAKIKAEAAAKAANLPAFADDSGLAVEALHGAPGIYSARYAGEPVDYAANNTKLLDALRGCTNRRARFRCVIALSSPQGEARCVEGTCPGLIIESLKGVKGFGYDPLFQPDGFMQTFAEMEATAKNRISHRGRALHAARQAWGTFLAQNPTSWPSANPEISNAMQ